MNPRELFGVVVRSVGLLTLVASFLYLASALGSSLEPYGPDAPSPQTYLGACIITFLFGTYLLRCAPHFVNFAYGPDTPESRKTDLTTDAL